jgi:hypothetical protein
VWDKGSAASLAQGRKWSRQSLLNVAKRLEWRVVSDTNTRDERLHKEQQSLPRDKTMIY